MQQSDHFGRAGEKRPAMSSGSANPGEHLFKGQNIVRVAPMVGEFFVDRRAMRIAQRNCRGSRCKTLPNQFNQAEPLFRGKLQNFSNVSVTHAE